MLAIAEQTEQKVSREVFRPLRVCFVCTGNTCRSPMAAAVANDLADRFRRALPESVRDSFQPRIVAISAGLDAADGDPITENAVKALEKAGVVPVPGQDYHVHKARRLTREIAQQCDMIVGMSASHVMRLMMEFPDLAGRITGMPSGISDPFGCNLETYCACLAEISEGVKTLLFPTQESK